MQPVLLHLFASLLLFADKSSILYKLCFTCAYRNELIFAVCLLISFTFANFVFLHQPDENF